MDERKEKLAKIEETAKRELGMLPPKEFSPEDIRGKFAENTSHLKRFKEKGGKANNALIIFLIIVLLWVWYAIMNGVI